MSIQVRQSDIIAIAVSVIVALILFGLMMRTTKKTLKEHARHSAEREHRINNDNSRRIFGGSGLKSITKTQGRDSYLTTTNAFILFTGILVGYILSYFR